MDSTVSPVSPVSPDPTAPADPADPTPGSPLDRHALRARVWAELTAFLDRQEKLLAGVGDELAPAVATLRDFLDGGKRMRPAFCYWGWRAAGGAESGSARQEAAAMRAAAALELLQASALIHDDFMDGSDTRRGAPSIHRRFAALHRAGGWGRPGTQGGADRFGAAAAILLGDITLTWCDEMFTRCGLPAGRIQRARPLFDLMRSEVMAGQYLDAVAQARGLSVSTPGEALARARTVITYKSAKYTVERPLQLGAALATGRADGPLIDALSAFGLPLGEAFQLRDDVLGVFGDPAATGKPAGDDLREGKQTVLIALAVDRAAAADAKELRSAVGDPALAPDGVARLQAIIAGTGALAAVERRIGELTEAALGALRRAGITAEAREALAELAVAATDRTG
ncbi:MAG TPA: polyprenyl synthetase family protein [Actinocrinis sp.]